MTKMAGSGYGVGSGSCAIPFKYLSYFHVITANLSTLTEEVRPTDRN